MPEEPKERPPCTERSREIQPKKKNCANGDTPVLEVGKKPPRSTPAPIVQAADTRHVQRSIVCGPSNRTMNDAVHGKQKTHMFYRKPYMICFFSSYLFGCSCKRGETHGQQPARPVGPAGIGKDIGQRRRELKSVACGGVPSCRVRFHFCLLSPFVSLATRQWRRKAVAAGPASARRKSLRRRPMAQSLQSCRGGVHQVVNNLRCPCGHGS